MCVLCRFRPEDKCNFYPLCYISCFPLAFHLVSISPNSPFCVRQCKIKAFLWCPTSLSLLSSLLGYWQSWFGFALLAGLLSEYLIQVSRLNKAKRSCVSADAKPYCIHHPHRARRFSASLLLLLRLPRCRPGNHLLPVLFQKRN